MSELQSRYNQLVAERFRLRRLIEVYRDLIMEEERKIQDKQARLRVMDDEFSRQLELVREPTRRVAMMYQYNKRVAPLRAELQKELVTLQTYRNLMYVTQNKLAQIEKDIMWLSEEIARVRQMGYRV
jgi:chromosome segregation ATPase